MKTPGWSCSARRTTSATSFEKLITVQRQGLSTSIGSVGTLNAVSSSNQATQTETALLDLLSKIQSSWPSSEWSWDQRHACATSVLATKAQTQARTQLLTALP